MSRRQTSCLVVIMGLSSCAFIMAQRSDPRGVQVKSAQSEQAENVSKVVPTEVAAYLTKFGLDRPVDAEEAALLKGETVGPGDAVRALKLSEVSPLPRKAQIERLDESEVGETRLIAGSDLELSGSVELRFGTQVFPGDIIVRGLILNAGDTSVVLSHVSGEYVLQPGAAAFVGGAATSCETDCREGSYACCYQESTGGAHCDCIGGNSPSDPKCNVGGGPGSSRCSINLAQ